MKKLVLLTGLVLLVNFNGYSLTAENPVVSEPSIVVRKGSFHSSAIVDGHLLIRLNSTLDIYNETDGLYAWKIPIQQSDINGVKMVEYIMAKLVNSNSFEIVTLYAENASTWVDKEFNGSTIKVASSAIVGIKFERYCSDCSYFSGGSMGVNNIISYLFFKKNSEYYFNVQICLLANDLRISTDVASLTPTIYSFKINASTELEYTISQFVQLVLFHETPYGNTKIRPVPGPKLSGTPDEVIKGFQFQWHSPPSRATTFQENIP